MRVWLAAIFLQIPFVAVAQTVVIQAPDSVIAGTPFSVAATLTCPPPGEAPPPVICDRVPPAIFVSSDAFAILPATRFFLVKNQTVTLSQPVTPVTPGMQSIILLDAGDFPGIFIAVKQIVVGAPASLPVLGTASLIALFLTLTGLAARTLWTRRENVRS